MYYETIDEMPLWNWRKCTEGKTEFVRLNKKVGNKKKDADVWTFLYDENIERFGLGKDQETIYELRLRLAELQCDYCIEGNTFMLNEIRMIEQEIIDIVDRIQNGASIDECLMVLSKWMGFRINQKETTVAEFYTYLNAFQDEGKKTKQEKTA